MERRLKIGLAGFFHANARGDEEVFRRAADGLGALAEKWGFHLHTAARKIYTYEDAESVVRELNSEGADFSFLFCASVANGEAVIPFRSLGSRIGIWSVEETTSSGYLPINSFCGSMILSGILGSYLKGNRIRYKWFYGYPDSPIFLERFGITFHALSALKVLANSRIACVGPVVRGFDHLIVDQEKLLREYGIRLDRFHSVEEIAEMAGRIPDAEARAETERMLSGAGVRSKVTGEELDRSARLRLALEKLCLDSGCTMLSLSCWTRLQDVFGTAACAAVSRLNSGGIVTSCEGDIDGAVSMTVLKTLLGTLPTMVDIVNLDPGDDSINLWHCGPAPECLADGNGLCWDRHFDIGRCENGQWRGCGTVANLNFKPGDITIARISTRADELIALRGEVCRRDSYQGSSGWVRNISILENRMDIREVMALLYRCHADHHVAFGYGNCENELREFAAWKNLKIQEYRPYVPYLESV